MKQYDLIVIGTGSAMAVVEPFLERNPRARVAVIDKDEPGGICLTRGCIPSKILLYPAELVQIIQKASDFGIGVQIRNVDFAHIMARMRDYVGSEIASVREGLSTSAELDYYPEAAEFVAPYTLKVGDVTLKSGMIFLCTGSKPLVPPIKGLVEAGYLTSDTLLNLESLPESICVIGGGYIAAEYGHFFSAMGSKVTIIGRNPRFLPEEEPEIGEVMKRELGMHSTIYTGYEVREVQKAANGKKLALAVDRQTGKQVQVEANEILVASGRAPNTDILHPERANIKTDKKGWISVNKRLETSQPNIWALGDANGVHMFKHKANYEAEIVYRNAVLRERVEVDYHAVPHAVFAYPEVASVGLKEREAITAYGERNILVGFQSYTDTAKGFVIGAKDYHFAKVIVEAARMRILGAHIVGPHASILIQEVVNIMNTKQQSAEPLTNAMHIHPALSEVVSRAFNSLMEPRHYHHVLGHYLTNHDVGEGGHNH